MQAQLCLDIARISHAIFRKSLQSREREISRVLPTALLLWTHDIIKSKITKNLLKLPKDAGTVQIENPLSIINDQVLNKFRDHELRPLFQGKWTGLPECLVKKDGKPKPETDYFRWYN